MIVFRRFVVTSDLFELISVEYQYCCVYKPPYHGLILTIFGAKKTCSIFQNFDFSSRTYSSVDFFSLYWSGQTFSFFSSVHKQWYTSVYKQLFSPPFKQFCLFDRHFFMFINSYIALFINGVYLAFMNTINIGHVISRFSGRMGLRMKLIAQKELIFLFQMAPSRILWDQ